MPSDRPLGANRQRLRRHHYDDADYERLDSSIEDARWPRAVARAGRSRTASRRWSRIQRVRSSVWSAPVFGTSDGRRELRRVAPRREVRDAFRGVFGPLVPSRQNRGGCTNPSRSRSRDLRRRSGWRNGTALATGSKPTRTRRPARAAALRLRGTPATALLACNPRPPHSRPRGARHRARLRRVPRRAMTGPTREASTVRRHLRFFAALIEERGTSSRTH